MTDWKPIKTYKDVQRDEHGFVRPALLWNGRNASVGHRDRGVWYALADGWGAYQYDGETIITVEPTHWAPIEPPKRRGK